MSRPLTVALFVAGSIAAGAGGSYLALRDSAAPVAEAAPLPAAAVDPAVPAPGSTGGAKAVQETEGVIEAPKAEPPAAAPELERTPEAVPARPAPESRRRAVPSPVRAQRQPTVRAANTAPAPAEAAPPRLETPAPANATPDPAPVAVAERTPPPVEPAAPTRPEPVLTEVVIPASSVIGLKIETTVSSERARLEDRVEARVTRDVFADGRLALPAGSRVIGAVSLVERGGKVKERARLGIRFHTVVLASGRQVSLRTEPIYREGDSPAGDSSRKIGGAAIGGAVLGAILGGGKGAIAGGAAGAAGGTAVVMAGDRHPAVLSSGSIVTVKLASPASLDVER
jgi:hypothetical protein